MGFAVHSFLGHKQGRSFSDHRGHSILDHKQSADHRRPHYHFERVEIEVAPAVGLMDLQLVVAEAISVGVVAVS